MNNHSIKDLIKSIEVRRHFKSMDSTTFFDMLGQELDFTITEEMREDYNRTQLSNIAAYSVFREFKESGRDNLFVSPHTTKLEDSQSQLINPEDFVWVDVSVTEDNHK